MSTFTLQTPDASRINLAAADGSCEVSALSELYANIKIHHVNYALHGTLVNGDSATMELIQCPVSEFNAFNLHYTGYQGREIFRSRWHNIRICEFYNEAESPDTRFIEIRIDARDDVASIFMRLKIGRVYTPAEYALLYRQMCIVLGYFTDHDPSHQIYTMTHLRAFSLMKMIHRICDSSYQPDKCPGYLELLAEPFVTLWYTVMGFLRRRKF